MKSGIYKLTFSSGHYYIGKSKDIPRRWKEHWNSFSKGTASKIMQEYFNKYGLPVGEVLYEIHPEHLDVIEPIIIHNSWGPLILNTTKENCAVDMRNEYLELCKLSLGNLCSKILLNRKQIKNLEDDLERETYNFIEVVADIKNGTALEQAERINAIYKVEFSKLSKQLTNIKNRSLLQRIFNYGPI